MSVKQRPDAMTEFLNAARVLAEQVHGGFIHRDVAEIAVGGAVAAAGLSPSNVAREAIRILMHHRAQRAVVRTDGEIVITVKS